MHPSERRIDFEAEADARLPYRASVDGQHWQVRVNDFPEHPAVYTLLIDGEEVADVAEWPSCWRRPVAAGDQQGRPGPAVEAATELDAHLQGDLEQELQKHAHQRGIAASKLVCDDPLPAAALFARKESQSAADLLAAEREALANGKEAFSYARLAELFGRAPPDFEPILRQDYYLCHPEMLNLTEYAAHLRLMDLWAP